MAETVTITGLRELQARLRVLADTVGEKKAAKPVTAALRKAANVLKGAVQENLRRGGHVKSGALVNNIITSKVRSNPGTVTLHVGVRSNAKKFKDTKANRRKQRVGGTYQSYGPLFYARFLEFGTSHQQQSPFMRPAFEGNKGQLPDIVRDELKERLDNL